MLVFVLNPDARQITTAWAESYLSQSLMVPAALSIWGAPSGHIWFVSMAQDFKRP
jgi:hypothetical protein